MSEDFDKEAERERLREKYERDEEDRESTERMSELLLQGATMTNRHCDTCGSPIFRYQGQEFCPNCQMEADGEQPAQEGAEAARAGGAEDVAATGTDQRSDAPQADGQPRQPQQPRQTPNQPTGTPGRQAGSRDPSASMPGQDAAAPVDGDSLDDTQAALAQTLARFSQLAASTDDPHRAREYLETAKAAAETLRALPR
ncbi:MAG: Sjogren's syndrome/scleroderma autoantigen 1 family protein [Halanaeroarchaeum sp.]